jgi:predicted hydrolase (HD superfamily)
MTQRTPDDASLTAFPTLINAAREFIEERLATLHDKAFNLTIPEDVESVRREQASIEQEIDCLSHLLDVARALAKMQHIQLEKQLRQTGHIEAADRITALVQAVAALDEDSGQNKGEE